MTTLEKILQEIEQYEESYEGPGTLTLCPGWAKEIIKKHLSANDLNVPANDGKISIDDERLWQILFDEACVEGQQADRIYKQLKEICGDGWIPVEEGMPKCEEEVWIITEKGTQTSAMYEDGTMLGNNSKWNWTDIDGEWDEEEDCIIIPEGWYEYRYFKSDDIYNSMLYEKVIAWRPMLELYRKDGE